MIMDASWLEELGIGILKIKRSCACEYWPIVVIWREREDKGTCAASLRHEWRFAPSRGTATQGKPEAAPSWQSIQSRSSSSAQAQTATSQGMRCGVYVSTRRSEHAIIEAIASMVPVDVPAGHTNTSEMPISYEKQDCTATEAVESIYSKCGEEQPSSPWAPVMNVSKCAARHRKIRSCAGRARQNNRRQLRISEARICSFAPRRFTNGRRWSAFLAAAWTALEMHWERHRVIGPQ